VGGPNFYPYTLQHSLSDRVSQNERKERLNNGINKTGRKYGAIINSHRKKMKRQGNGSQSRKVEEYIRIRSSNSLIIYKRIMEKNYSAQIQLDLKQK